MTRAHKARKDLLDLQVQMDKLGLRVIKAHLAQLEIQEEMLSQAYRELQAPQVLLEIED